MEHKSNLNLWLNDQSAAFHCVCKEHIGRDVAENVLDLFTRNLCSRALFLDGFDRCGCKSKVQGVESDDTGMCVSIVQDPNVTLSPSEIALGEFDEQRTIEQTRQIAPAGVQIVG